MSDLTLLTDLKTAFKKEGWIEPGPLTPPSAGKPSDFIDLKNWYLTLPSGPQGSPDTIHQPILNDYSSIYFSVNPSKNGVQFAAWVDGVHTKNSSYPRSELREMKGTDKASWSNKSGTHTMTVKQAITHTPVVKPHVVAAQIHDSSDDIIMVRLEGKNLFVEAKGNSIGVLEPNYSLGTIYTVKIVAAGSRIKVYYNDVLKVDYAKSGSGYYYKAGCYTQSNLSKGDKADAYGEVIIYSLEVKHE